MAAVPVGYSTVLKDALPEPRQSETSVPSSECRRQGKVAVGDSRAVGAVGRVVVDHEAHEGSRRGKASPRRNRRVRKNSPGRAEIDDLLDLVLRQPEGDGDEDCAQPGARDVDEQVVGRVVRDEEHPVALAHTGPREQLGELARQMGGLRDGPPPVAVDNRQGGRPGPS